MIAAGKAAADAACAPAAKAIKPSTIRQKVTTSIGVWELHQTFTTALLPLLLAAPNSTKTLTIRLKVWILSDPTRIRDFILS